MFERIAKCVVSVFGGKQCCRAAGFRPRLETLDGRDVPAVVCVTSLEDSGSGSLRQAIINANTIDGGADTININVTGTIWLQSALPALLAGDVIANSGPLTITREHDAPEFRLFTFIAGPSSVSNIRFFNGRATDPLGAEIDGGAIKANELAVYNCQFEYNQSDGNGGAILAGVFSAYDSYFVQNFAIGNGGAIYSVTNGATTTTISNTLIHVNSSRGYGGGIYNESLGYLNIVNGSAVESNGAGGFGGAVYNSTASLFIESGVWMPDNAYLGSDASAIYTINSPNVHIDAFIAWSGYADYAIIIVNTPHANVYIGQQVYDPWIVV